MEAWPSTPARSVRCSGDEPRDLWHRLSELRRCHSTRKGDRRIPHEFEVSMRKQICRSLFIKIRRASRDECSGQRWLDLEAVVHHRHNGICLVDPLINPRWTRRVSEVSLPRLSNAFLYRTDRAVRDAGKLGVGQGVGLNECQELLGRCGRHSGDRHRSGRGTHAIEVDEAVANAERRRCADFCTSSNVVWISMSCLLEWASGKRRAAPPGRWAINRIANSGYICGARCGLNCARR